MSHSTVRSRSFPRLRMLACAITVASVASVPIHAAAGSASRNVTSDPRSGEESGSELDELRAEVEELRRRDEHNRARMAELEAVVQRLVADHASSSAAAALDRALAGSARRPVPTVPTVAPAAGATRGDVWSAPIAGGAAVARLIDTSLVTLVAAGGSSVGNDAVEELQGGAHDPNRNGFTLQQAELSFTGAVDPYFNGEAHIVASLDGVELEEAFLTTTSLPWGLQVEAGYFFTEFGLLNPLHPHAWDWMDQPVVNTRMFGGEGLRSPGARVAWLLPTPFFSELHVGVQNADEGELTASFVAEDGVGGRPNLPHDVRSADDMLWLVRSNSSWDLGPQTALLLGVSGLHGPNATGPDGETWIYGADVKVRWRAQDNFRGWPFFLWQGEFVRRDYEADRFTAGSAEEPPSEAFPEDLSDDTLHDQGFYTQALYGFRYRWAAGVRAEVVTAAGRSVDDGVLVSHDDDPLRDDRLRLSPLLVWHPTEFSRLRLQYNYDNAEHLDGNDAHTVWLGAEVTYGKHAGHKY